MRRFFNLPIAVAFVLSGCSSIAPKAPERPQSASFIQPEWQEEIPAFTEKQKKSLLDLSDTPALTKLVEETLQGNLDLQQTALRIKKNKLTRQNTHNTRLPTLDASLQSQRAENASSISNQHDLALNLNWEVDVWGRLADSAATADYQLAAMQSDYKAAQSSLAARVMQQWLNIQYNQQIINIEQKRLATLLETESVIKERYQAGLGNLADLDSAKTRVYQVRATIKAKELRQKNAQRQLAELRGINSDTPFTTPVTLPSITFPAVELPISVIGHRPDLKAAYLNVLSADKATRASYKQLLPGFNITASLSQSRTEFNDLLSGSSSWFLLGKLTAPLFNAGRIKRAAEADGLEAEISYLAYKQTLLNAVNEVEIALATENSLSLQQKDLTSALNHARKSRDYFLGRYQKGLSSILELLTATQSVYDAESQLTETIKERFNNRITLALALGLGPGVTK